MKKIYLLLLVLPLLAACSNSGSLKPSYLEGRVFVLTSVNGQPFTSRERTPELRFSENMQISGRICNTFGGQGTLKNNVLTVPQMVSTLMMCADDRLNTIERDFSTILREGADISVSNQTLRLSRGGTTLEYVER